VHPALSSFQLYHEYKIFQEVDHTLSQCACVILFLRSILLNWSLLFRLMLCELSTHILLSLRVESIQSFQCVRITLISILSVLRFSLDRCLLLSLFLRRVRWLNFCLSRDYIEYHCAVTYAKNEFFITLRTIGSVLFAPGISFTLSDILTIAVNF
jgi:hypothetical protein